MKNTRKRSMRSAEASLLRRSTDTAAKGRPSFSKALRQVETAAAVSYPLPYARRPEDTVRRTPAPPNKTHTKADGAGCLRHRPDRSLPVETTKVSQTTGSLQFYKTFPWSPKIATPRDPLSQTAPTLKFIATFE